MHRNRQIAGAIGRKTGLSFEAETDRVWDELHRDGLGVMRRTDVQARMINGVWRPIGPGPFDRFGIINSDQGIIPVYYEIKTHTVKQRRMPDKHTLPEGDAHQLDGLREFYLIGGCSIRCFVLFDWRCEYPTGESLAEMRVHPITQIVGRTIYRKRGIHCINRNWYDCVVDPSYQAVADAAILLDDEIPV